MFISNRNNPQPQDEIKSAPDHKEPEAPYVIVYIFDGAWDSYYVGHATFWDGGQYYSYFPSEKDQPWIWPSPPSVNYPEAEADSRANKQKPSCGEWKKIIFPVSSTFDRKAIEEKISAIWKTSQYKLALHNCVHQVTDHLLEAGIFNKEDVENILIATPSVFANHCLEIGKNRFQRQLDTEAKENTQSKIENRRNYLSLLKESIYQTNTPTNAFTSLEPLLREKKFSEMKDEEINGLYFKIKKYIGEKHYNALEQESDFYALWFGRSLVSNLKLEQKTFVYDEDVLKMHPNTRYNIVHQTIKVLCMALQDHFKIAEGGNIDKEVAAINREFKGKNCLKLVFKALLNVILAKIPDEKLKPSREEFLTGKRPLLYHECRNEIDSIIEQLQNPGWREKEASLFGRGIIEIMQYAIKFSEHLLLDQTEDYKNLIESMRNIAQIDRVTNPKYKFALPLKQVIEGQEKFAFIKSRLDDPAISQFVCQDFITKMIMVNAPRDYLDPLIKAFADGAHSEIIAKKILIDIADRGSRVFGNGEQAEMFCKSFITKLQDQDDLAVEAAEAKRFSP